jgi:hypothetical protein
MRVKGGKMECFTHRIKKSKTGHPDLYIDWQVIE